MAYYVQKSLSTAGVNATRLLYWIRKFVVDAAAAFPGRLTLVDSHLQGGGDWLSETGPLTGSYIVVESGYDHAGVKWQAIIGARNAAGTIGGIAGAVTGLVIGLAPDGGWVPSPGAETFGASLFSGLQCPRASGAGNNNATNFHLAIVEKIVGGIAVNAALILVGDDNKDGTWDVGCYVGSIYDWDETYTKPCVLLAGNPQGWDGGFGQDWSSAAGSHGWVPNGAWAGWDAAMTHPTNDTYRKGGYMLTAHGGEPAMIPAEVLNNSTLRTLGWLVEVYRTDAGIASGTESTDHLRVVYNGLCFPCTP